MVTAANRENMEKSDSPPRLDIQKAMRIPDIYRDLRLKDLHGVEGQIKQARGALFNDQSLTLVGPCGTGKTHLATVLMREWMRGRKLNSRSFPLFFVVPVLYADIKGTFGDGAIFSEDYYIAECLSRPLIVLDDLGAGKMTDYLRDVLYRIIDGRYRKKRQTIVTSNLSLDDIADKIDDRIASRLCGMGPVISLGDEDWRVKKQIEGGGA